MLHVVCLFTSLPCIALLLNFNRAALANHFPFSFVDILCLDDDSDEDDFYDVASSLGNSSGLIWDNAEFFILKAGSVLSCSTSL